jgi:hypothetical protein
MIVGGVALVLTVVLIPIAVAELGEWSPWLAARLVRRAARKLPPDQRDRYEAEWLAELEALPSKKYSQLVKGLQLYSASAALRSALLGLPSPATQWLRSAANRLIAIALLLLTLPVLIICGAVVWAVLGGPVIYRRNASGQRGRDFALLSFRTMPNPAQFDSSWRPAGSSALTFMRSTSLNELPSLLNVLSGDLHIVGQRHREAL